MNRRDWMKMVAAGAPAAFLPSGLTAGGTPEEIYVVTDDPSWVSAELRRMHLLDLHATYVNRRPIAPSSQDVTVIRRGRIIDPAAAPDVQPRLLDFVQRVRTRRSPGSWLVSLESRLARSGDAVFESSGRVVETIGRDRSYNRIEIPGRLGTTVFALSGGVLRVVRASCRHELCRRSGGIESGRIICAPNGLVASIGGQEIGLDAITG